MFYEISKHKKFLINFINSININIIFITIKNEDQKAIEDFSSSISFNNKYIKSYVNRMMIFYRKEDYIEALDGIYNLI